MDPAEAIEWLREVAEVSLRAATLSTERDATRTHGRCARAAEAGAEALEQVDDLRAMEMAASALLRASGPGVSWGEQETAERALCDLLAARGHDVGEES